MRINYKDGSMSEVSIEQIDSITFVEQSEVAHEATLVGEWLWGNVEQGYYELLNFNEDNTYTGYDNYFTYGFDTMTYGWYFQNGTMLSLQSNGYGYNRRYNWFIIGMTQNALDVMTKMGRFTYYRVQSDVYSLRVGEESYGCSEDDYYVFTDGTKVTDIDGEKLKGISEGTTYCLRYNAASGLIMAYKVVVNK